MPLPDAITVFQLSRLIGTPNAPLIIDMRTDEDIAADPRFLPTSINHDDRTVASWADEYAGRSVAVTCQRGGKLDQGTAAGVFRAAFK
jgi:rhodanese-related sulfurtransferase